MYSFALAIIAIATIPAIAQENTQTETKTIEENIVISRPDGHAPIGVIGDHIHSKGDWMFSYKFMPMTMSGNLNKSDDIRDEDLFQHYMAAPQDMQMHMHMLGMMYAPTDNITLMAMANYLSNEMDLKTKMGMDFQTTSSGISDISLGALIKLYKKGRQGIHANISVSLPTGDIDQRGDTPMMNNAQLAYPMQLGSGTYDPKVGITYLGQSDKLSWGAQTSYKTRLGENDEEYSLGDVYNFTSWAAVKASNNISISARINYTKLGEIDGADADMNPMMMPLFNTANSGRSDMDLGIGMNYFIAEGAFKNLRFGAEINFPIVQDVKGMQMKREMLGTVGIQYAIGANCH